MASVKEFEDHFLMLCEAGFIAVNQYDEDAATKLFAASALLKPESTLPKIGRGYMHMMKLELKQACNLFDEVLVKEPDNEMAKSFLGLSYTLTATDVAKGEKMLEEMATKAEEPLVKQLADSALEFVDKFVKKAPTPAEPQKKANKKDKKKSE